jgi:hypothetical protein
MLYIFCAVHYYADLLITPTTAQLHFYTLRHVPYAALLRKNILPEDGRMVAPETRQRVHKCNCAVVGFNNKYALILATVRFYKQ